MNKVRITQVRSSINRTKNQKLTLSCLGLGNIGSSKEIVVNQQTLGMFKTIDHLVKIQKI